MTSNSPGHPSRSLPGASAPIPGATGATGPTGVAERFSPKASLYTNSEQASGRDLEMVVEAVRASGARRVLDVATGPGTTALAVAGPAEWVVGIDISEGMLQEARRRAAESCTPNVHFELARAEDLPFAAASFDALTCRLAPHHFEDVHAFLAGAARVVRPGGALVVLDSLAPDDAGIAAALHELEVRRDPTHRRSYTRREWSTAVGSAGFEVIDQAVVAKPKLFEPWLRRGGASEADHAPIRDLVRAAPTPFIEAMCFEFDPSGSPHRFADEKLLTVARRRGS